MTVKIATRKSKLAVTQTDLVIEHIKKKNNNIECEKVKLQTEGDRRLDVTLDKIGGKGVFTKEIEYALLDGRAHGAVHSMKDMPFALGDDFKLTAIPEREDPRDAFISMNGMNFKDLPKGARIGTGSIRRDAQLRLLRPDIEIVPIRGNVQTRISKIEKENLHGIILAAAGLKRLGMECIIKDYFDPYDFVPSVGQGALGVETLKDGENIQVFESIDNKEVRICVEGERSFMRTLNGGCHVVIGAYGTLDKDRLHMVGIFKIGDKIIKKDIEGYAEDNIKLGEALAEKIIRAENYVK
ncbi:hydroxymethylbilane synthase [Clostridium hydrogeniformans]|uniref:hydroxymethylbilane synthase n=1 Tax=Clostridium hydrogeniformans TaxID=349933 RepID=UPI00047FA812|nr:hydroxymethylbilane synthase [Clostridium hydrogeniformans]